jgi:serine/threonine-protein kinase
MRAVKAPEPSMPPDYADVRPSDEERKVIEDWIVAGAPLPEAQDREFQNDDAVLSAIRDHLRGLDRPQDRRNQRYLLLANLHNNKQVREDQLRLTRAAASLLLNDLSWKKEIRLPKVLDDKAKVVLQVDLRWYGWNQSTWERLLKEYPYGVKHRNDRRLKTIEDEIESMSGTQLSYIRVDWFVANASQSPLYERILQIPASIAALEKKLLIDSQKAFLNDELARAGVIASNVSQQNRLVERMESPYGAYWRSYDFRSSDFEANIVRFPLGPKFEENSFNDFAFVQAGGEVIFNLPNGLQAYLLADAKNNRLTGPAPIDIVRDRNEKGGGPQVINGLSCMACHKEGMIGFRDVIRARSAVKGRALDKVERLFPERDRMEDLVSGDRKRFLDALDLAAGPFLRGDLPKNKDRAAVEYPEPISSVARLYLADLTAAAAAAEFGFDDVAKFTSAVRANRQLEALGLGPLLDDGGLKRQLWQASPASLFHQVGFEFDLTAVK